MDGRLIRLTRGVPAVSTFPTGKLAVSASSVLEKHGDEILQYGQSQGFPPLLECLAHETNTRAGQIVIGQGSLSLLDLIIRLLVEPGDWVFTEEPTYDRTLTVLRRAGARIRGVPLEDDGPDVDYLERCLDRGEKPVLMYLIPDFQNPSGTVLSLEKRGRIIDLAREHGFLVVEDVPYRKLRYRGHQVASFLELAPDCVIQLSSFSKLISPGLRVGYVIVPEQIAEPLARIAEDTYINASHLNQAIVFDFIDRGWLGPQIDAIKMTYQPRLDAMLAALDADMGSMATWRRPDGGFFIGMTLNASVGAEELQRKAREADLLLTDGRGFFPGGGGDTFVRLPFCALTEQEIKDGVAGLADVVRSLA